MLGMEKRKVISWSQVINLEKSKHLSVEKTSGTKKATKKASLPSPPFIIPTPTHSLLSSAIQFLFKTAAELDEAYGIISLIWKNQSRVQLDEDGGGTDESDLLSSSSSSLTLSAELRSTAPSRPSATAISNNLNLAVDIPGLPTKDDWSILYRFLSFLSFLFKS